MPCLFVTCRTTTNECTCAYPLSDGASNLCPRGTFTSSSSRSIYRYAAPPLPVYTLPNYTTLVTDGGYCTSTATDGGVSPNREPAGCILACQTALSVGTNVRFVFDFDLNSFGCFCGFTCGSTQSWAPYRSYAYNPPGEQ